MDYNPVPLLGRIAAKLLAINFADGVVNPPELGVAEPAIRQIAGRSASSASECRDAYAFHPCARDLELESGGIPEGAQVTAVTISSGLGSPANPPFRILCNGCAAT